MTTKQLNLRHSKKQKAILKRTFLRNDSKINWVNSSLTILFLGVGCLTVFVINIYQMSFISWLIPTSIWFLTGLILTPFTSSFFIKYYKTNNFFLHVVYNIVTWGGIVLFGIMAPNYYYPKENQTSIKVSIMKFGTLAKGRNSMCAQPYAEVVINNMTKQLIFPCVLDIKKFRFIEVSIKNGLFGIEIITKKNVLAEQ